MHRLRQDRANRECLAPVKNRTAETCQSIRLTNVDPSNEPMRRISKEVALYYTKTLNETVRQTFHLNNSSFTSSMPTLTLKCAHDCIVDPFTDEKIAPHFIADCIDQCNYLADVVVKDKFGDSEPQLYVVLAAIAKKDMKRTQKSVKNAEKSVAKAENKLKAGVKKSGKSGKANEALAKAKNTLIKAKSAAKQAEKKVEDATTRADESIKFQSAVIQCWIKALGELVKAASHTIPDCVGSCRIILPTGSKISDQHRCTCEYGYVIYTGFSCSDIFVEFRSLLFKQVKSINCLYV